MDASIIRLKLNNGLTKFIFDEKWNSQQTARQDHTPSGEIKPTYIGKKVQLRIQQMELNNGSTRQACPKIYRFGTDPGGYLFSSIAYENKAQ